MSVRLVKKKYCALLQFQFNHLGLFRTITHVMCGQIAVSESQATQSTSRCHASRLPTLIPQVWNATNRFAQFPEQISLCAEPTGKCLVLVFMMQYLHGIPWWLSGKDFRLQYWRPRFGLWVRKIPWRRKWQPTPVFLAGKPHGQMNLVGYSPWDRKRDTIEQLNNNNIKMHRRLFGVLRGLLQWMCGVILEALEGFIGKPLPASWGMCA